MANLKHQFMRSINENEVYGESKFLFKREVGLGGSEFFSYNDTRNIKDTAVDFSRYIKENFSEIKLAKDINVKHIESFLEYKKSNGCKNATVKQYNHRLYDTKNSSNTKIIGFETDSMHLEFFELDDSNTADNIYGQFTTLMLNYRKGAYYDGKAGYANYKMYWMSSNDMYYTIIRVENTVLYAYCNETSRNELNAILTSIDYDSWIDNEGSLYTVGSNAFNQIGNGQNGKGIQYLYDDIVTEPYIALKNCKSFSVSQDYVIRATTDDLEYMWGKNHKPIPTRISDEFPEKTTKFDLAKKKVILNDEYGLLNFENSPLKFYYEDNNIYKKYGDEEYGKIVKSNISNSFLASLGEGLLTASCADDDCVYLFSYDINEQGKMINIKSSLLLDIYAVPIYIKDSQHIAFAKPNFQRELILNTDTGKTENGEFLNYQNLDNKPEIAEEKARKIALKELSKSGYKKFAGDEHNFSTIESATLEYKANYCGDYLNSWVTEHYFNNDPSWVWKIIVGCEKEDLCQMYVYVNAADGTVLYIANSND